MLIVKKGTGDTEGAVLEVWEGLRVKKRLVVPKTQHGAVYNDGCFATGASWSMDESRVAYIAEVCATLAVTSLLCPLPVVMLICLI